MGFYYAVIVTLDCTILHSLPLMDRLYQVISAQSRSPFPFAAVSLVSDQQGAAFSNQLQGTCGNAVGAAAFVGKDQQACEPHGGAKSH